MPLFQYGSEIKSNSKLNGDSTQVNTPLPAKYRVSRDSSNGRFRSKSATPHATYASKIFGMKYSPATSSTVRLIVFLVYLRAREGRGPDTEMVDIECLGLSPGQPGTGVL